MDWKALSTEISRSLAVLSQDGHARSVCNRAYYAAYALVTGSLPAGLDFPLGRHNPGHQDLNRYVKLIAEATVNEQREIRKSLTVLRNNRVDADYFPDRVIDSISLRESVRAFYSIQRILG